jgi:hypothetical protein
MKTPDGNTPPAFFSLANSVSRAVKTPFESAPISAKPKS